MNDNLLLADFCKRKELRPILLNADFHTLNSLLRLFFRHLCETFFIKKLMN
jgi:hypothetical protein